MKRILSVLILISSTMAFANQDKCQAEQSGENTRLRSGRIGQASSTEPSKKLNSTKTGINLDARKKGP